MSSSIFRNRVPIAPNVPTLASSDRSGHDLVDAHPDLTRHLVGTGHGSHLHDILRRSGRPGIRPRISHPRRLQSAACRCLSCAAGAWEGHRLQTGGVLFGVVRRSRFAIMAAPWASAVVVPTVLDVVIFIRDGAFTSIDAVPVIVTTIGTVWVWALAGMAVGVESPRDVWSGRTPRSRRGLRPTKSVTERGCSCRVHGPWVYRRRT